MPQKRITSLSKDNSDKLLDSEDSSKEIADDSDQTNSSKRKSLDSSKSEDITTDFKNDDSCSTTRYLSTQLTLMSGPRSSAEEVDTSSDNANNRSSTSPSVIDPPNLSEVQTDTCLDSAWKPGLCVNCNRSVDDPECSLYRVPLPDELEIALRPHLSSSNLEQQQPLPLPSSAPLRLFIFILSIFVFLIELLFATFEFYFLVFFGACSILFSYFYNRF